MDRNRSCHTLLLAAAVLALAIAPAAAADYPASVKKAVNSIYGKEIQRHADVLASDAYEGREAGKLGAVMAGNYVARFFKAYGLKPLGENGSFFQSFSVRGASPQAGKLEDANTLEVLSARKGSAPRGFAYGKDFLPYVFSASVSAEGDVVFAGYGITAPEYGYDDYKGLKVEGCIVLVLSHEPQEDDGDSVFEGRKLTRHADPRVKAELAAKRGAAALLIVPNPLHHRTDALSLPKLTAWPPENGKAVPIPVVRCSRIVAGEIFRREKKDLGKLQERIDKACRSVSVKARYTRLSLRVARKGDTLGVGRNVVAMLEGSDESLKKECVVIGAHYDHIGRGLWASYGKKGEIHNGANDNASGTAGVIALARAITENDVRPKRTLVFVAFDAEEKGLVGSKHYVASPPISLGNTIAMLNMDMIGRGPIRKIKVGGGTLNTTLHGILSRISGRFRMGLDLKGLDRFLRNSDQAPFMDKGIPCIFLSSGLFKGLHTQDDDAHLLNQKKMQAIVRTMMLVAYEVANLKGRP